MIKVHSNGVITVQLPFMKAIKKKADKVKKYFRRPVIVYSETFPPAILIKSFANSSGKYARVQFTNRQDANGLFPTTDIPAHLVVKAVKGNSYFMRDLIKYKILNKNWMLNDNEGTK